MSSLSLRPSPAYLSPSHAKSLKCKCASLYNGRPRGSKGWLRHTGDHACMTSSYLPSLSDTQVTQWLVPLGKLWPAYNPTTDIICEGSPKPSVHVSKWPRWQFGGGFNLEVPLHWAEVCSFGMRACPYQSEILQCSVTYQIYFLCIHKQRPWSVLSSKFEIITHDGCTM